MDPNKLAELAENYRQAVTAKLAAEDAVVVAADRLTKAREDEDAAIRRASVARHALLSYAGECE